MPTEGWEGEVRNHDWGGFVSAQSPPNASGCCSQEASVRADADSDLSIRIDGLVSGDIVGYARLSAPNVFTDVNTFSGGIRFFQTTVDTDYTLTANDYEVLVDASSGDVVITLPSAIGDGQLYRVKKIDDTSNSVTVAPQSGDLIDGETDLIMDVQWDACSLIDASLDYWDKVSEPFPVLPSDIARLGIANVFTDLNTFTGLRIASKTVSEDTLLTPLDFEVLVDATAGPVTIFLPTSAGNGQYYRIKKIDASANIVTVQADGSDLIDDSTSLNFFDQWADCTLIDAAAGYWDSAGSSSGSESSVTSAGVAALVQTASAAATSANAHANIVSARVVSVSTELNSLLTSGDAALSTRIDNLSFGTGSVTSQEVSALVQIASAAATSADAHANTVSGRVVSVSAELASLVQIASAAATSADGHANAASAAATSADAHAAAASAAATSAINKAISDNTSLSAVITASINTVSARVVSVSAELGSLIQIASAAATSADAHANTVSGRVVSVSAELASQLASTSATLETHINAVSAAGGGGGGTTVKVAGSDFTTSSVTLIDITGLTFAATANTKYEVDTLLACKSDSTAGLNLTVAFSAAGGTGGWYAIGFGTGNVGVNDAGLLGVSPGNVNFNTIANNTYTLRLKSIVVIGANTGNITMQIKKVTSGLATVLIGSRMTVTPL